jgi:hypothetical protein
MEPLAIVFGAGFTVAVATALGSMLLGERCRDYAVRFVCGAALLSLLVFFLCSVGLAYPAVFLLVGAGALASAVVTGRGQVEGKHATPIPVIAKYVFGPIVAAYFVIYLVNAMAPEVSPDGSAYHLSFVAFYLRSHGFRPITWNLYASLSEGVEMLFLFAFAFGRNSAAATVHFAFLVALAWQVFSLGRRVGLPIAGGCASVLVFASPIVGYDGASAYNDVALAAVAFTLFYLLQLWAESGSKRLLVAIGVVAGFCYGVKYTGWPAVVYAVGFVLWKRRNWRDAALVAGCAVPLIAPWMVKNWLWVHNPVAPFFNQYFRNPYITIAFEKEYTNYFKLYDLASRWQIPRAAMVSGQLQGLLGPVFLLAPLALLALRRPLGRQLLLASLVFGGSYFENIGTRFLIPALPFVALALAMVLASLPGLAVTIALLHAVLSWPAVIPRYAPTATMRLMKVPWREALRIRDINHYISSHLPEYPAARLVEAHTPPGSTIFSFRPIPEAYTSRRVLIGYESASNESLDRILKGAFAGGLQPTWRLRFDFPRQPLRAVRLEQTASGSDIWSIHELRILDQSHEVPRGTRWRLTADPFPWTVQEAFDNSPLTPWRSGEAIHPGMFVETDFGGVVQGDGVLIETSPDQSQIRLILKGMDEHGVWRVLCAAPKISDAPPPLGLRRAAVRELERRGVQYLLLFDGEFGADDFHANADLWGITQVGEVGGARLYRLP